MTNIPSIELSNRIRVSDISSESGVEKGNFDEGCSKIVYELGGTENLDGAFTRMSVIPGFDVGYYPMKEGWAYSKRDMLYMIAQGEVKVLFKETGEEFTVHENGQIVLPEGTEFRLIVTKPVTAFMPCTPPYMAEEREATSRRMVQLQKNAREIRDRYDALNRAAGMNVWGVGERVMGLVGDLGDLAKLVMAYEGYRENENVRSKLAHELSDCMWAIMTIADGVGIDLEQSFLATMKELEIRIRNEAGRTS